jgi:nicotinamide phosphoribosyltransferase
MTIPFNTQNVENLVLATDSYKLTHHNQYPPNVERVYSYFEARDGAKYPETTFFGLQYLMKRYLEGQAVTPRDVEEAFALAGPHFSDAQFNLNGWNHVAYDHGGCLPIRIKAVPEGMSVPNSNVLMTIENTCDRCYWLTNALESLLVHVWYPSTVATVSRHTLKTIAGHLDATGCTREGLPFMLHDFGYRGASSHESAAIGGCGHLVNSLGTDTLPAMIVAQRYYGADKKETAFSVPATEHSVMTSLGKDGEMSIVDRLIDDHPAGILSVVADSYDVYRFVDEVGTTFKDRILARDGVFVVRPDSVTETAATPQELMVELSGLLWDSFGGTTNAEGYRTLDSHVRLLWGDGIDPDGIDRILTECAKAGFAAENYVFGMGGGLLQKVNRDTQRFAFKCSAQQRDGAWFNVQKSPLDKSKTSKAGRLSLMRQGDGFATTPEADADVLETVFENGKIVKDYTFAEVRERAAL